MQEGEADEKLRGYWISFKDHVFKRIKHRVDEEAILGNPLLYRGWIVLL
ncbi:hypothetical protein OROMI_004000 [Orobanche minor]